MSVALAFLRRDFSLNISYRVSFIFQFLGIFFGVATFYFVARVFGQAVSPQLQAYGGDYFSFVLVGLAFSGFTGLALRGFAGAIREGQSMGTLELMLLSPTRLGSILLSSSIWDYLMNCFNVVIYLLFGALVFGADLSRANVLSALLVLVLSILAFSGIGIISAAFVLVLKKGDPVAWVFGSVQGLLAGVMYPVSVLPDILQKFSALLPLTYSLEAMRLAVLKGYSVLQLLPQILALIAFSVVLLPLSLWVFRRAVRQAKKEGSLAQY